MADPSSAIDNAINIIKNEHTAHWIDVIVSLAEVIRMIDKRHTPQTRAIGPPFGRAKTRTEAMLGRTPIILKATPKSSNFVNWRLNCCL